MKLVKASYEILEYPKNPNINVETAARTCYKSEDKISEGSAEKLTKGLLDRGHHAMLEFGGWIVVKFVSNRGFTHEVVRHRLTSLAQESTRYCNYSKGKFDSQLTYVYPEWMLEEKIKDVEKRAEFKSHLIDTWLYCEERYMELTALGCPAEIAREGLPIGLKAEIVVGANAREWMHIFSLRCSKKAHPRMREVMIPLREELRSLVPILFD